MNRKDLRVLKASNLPSDDSGSDGEENLRVARSLKTQQQHLDGVTVFWPSFCKVRNFGAAELVLTRLAMAVFFLLSKYLFASLWCGYCPL